MPCLKTERPKQAQQALAEMNAEEIQLKIKQVLKLIDAKK